MRLSVERLRWGLLGGGVLLLVVVIALLGYGRYRAVEAWRQIVRRSGATITRETNGVTYSQAMGGRTVFTIHAAKAVPQGDGRYSLHDAVMTLYGTTGDRADHVYGSEFEYDEKSGTAQAMGEVQMDLEVPKGLAKHGAAAPSAAANVQQGTKTAGSGTGEKADARMRQRVLEAMPGPGQSAEAIHVKTSGLVYSRKTGEASTTQETEFQYEGFDCRARGAEFDTNKSLVHLLADVRMTGTLRGRPATLNATKADLDRTNRVVVLARPVARSEGRTASAEELTLRLREDGSVEQALATGGVELRSGTQIVRAGRMLAGFAAGSVPKSAELTGGVTLNDASAVRPMQANARETTVRFDAKGAPSVLVGTGGVSAAAQQLGANGVWLHRTMSGEKATVLLERTAARKSSRVREVELAGAAKARGESLTQTAHGRGQGGLKTTSVAADDLRMEFAENAMGKDEPSQMKGAGHTALEQSAADGSMQTSTGDSLEVRFAPKDSGVEVASAVQTGGVRMRGVAAMKPGSKAPAEVSTGSAAKAVFDGGTNVLTLSGGAEMERGGVALDADEVVLEQGSGDATAQGHVRGTMVSATAQAGASVTPASPVTHVEAQSAVFVHAKDTAEFRGTEQQPAKLWQGASQIEAASLVLNREKDTLAARPAAGGVVHAVFAEASAKPGSAAAGLGSQNGAKRKMPGTVGGSSVAQRVVKMTGARLDYSGQTNEAVFAGGVRMEGVSGEVLADRAVMFLSGKGSGPAKGANASATAQPNPLNGSVEKVVVSGDVRLEQPGRHGTGQQLLYTAATDNFVLTGTPGHPPHIVDQQQGNITGGTLLFQGADSTIVVAGEAQHGQAGRVHTETEVKQ